MEIGVGGEDGDDRRTVGLGAIAFGHMWAEARAAFIALDEQKPQRLVVHGGGAELHEFINCLDRFGGNRLIGEFVGGPSFAEQQILSVFGQSERCFKSQ